MRGVCECAGNMCMCMCVCAWCVARVTVFHVATLTFCAAQNEKCMTNGPKTANGDGKLEAGSKTRARSEKRIKTRKYFTHTHTHTVTRTASTTNRCERWLS